MHLQSCDLALQTSLLHFCRQERWSPGQAARPSPANLDTPSRGVWDRRVLQRRQEAQLQPHVRRDARGTTRGDQVSQR